MFLVLWLLRVSFKGVSSRGRGVGCPGEQEAAIATSGAPCGCTGSVAHRAVPQGGNVSLWMKTKQQKQIVNFSETSVLVTNTTLGWWEACMMRLRKPVSARFPFMECLPWATNPA